jgi:hypothetical protein
MTGLVIGAWCALSLWEASSLPQAKSSRVDAAIQCSEYPLLRKPICICKSVHGKISDVDELTGVVGIGNEEDQWARLEALTR